mgnify:CR=1 FL=1
MPKMKSVKGAVKRFKVKKNGTIKEVLLLEATF